MTTPDTPNRLGCAESYEVVIHFQGGQQVHTHLDAVVEGSWGRKLDDYSEASVTLAKRELSEHCWRKLGGTWETRNRPDENGVMRKWLHMVEPGVEPWMHELTIYRDHGVVWQGPITEVTETRDEITIDARDVLFWLDRRVIDLTIGGTDPDGRPYEGQPTGAVLDDIMTKTFPVGNRPHNPNIAEHWRIDRATPTKYTATERIWKGSRTVGSLVRDLIQNGIDMFTLGRKIYMVPDFYRVPATPYRLTDDHFAGDIEVRKLGLDLATEGFVIAEPEQTSGTEPDNNPAPLFGNWPTGYERGWEPWYGRITRFHESQAQGKPTSEPGRPPNNSRSLEDTARAIRDYGFPCPRSITIPDGAALTPDAPVSIGQLVPGRPFVVEMTGWSAPISQVFRLNEVEVTWGPGESGGGGSLSEQVQISLATIRQPPVDNDSTQEAAA